MATTNTLAIRNVARTTDAPEPVVLHPVGYISRRSQRNRRPRWVTGIARGKSKARVGKAAPCKHRTSNK